MFAEQYNGGAAGSAPLRMLVAFFHDIIKAVITHLSQHLFRVLASLHPRTSQKIFAFMKLRARKEANQVKRRKLNKTEAGSTKGLY